MATHLTVRKIPLKGTAALKAKRRKRGVDGQRRNGLARFAGSWSEAQFREFEKATEVFGEVAPELWR